MCNDYKNATPEQDFIQLKRHLYKPMAGFEKESREPAVEEKGYIDYLRGFLINF